MKKKPNLIIGCGGNRDKLKRPKMGVVANKYANKVYITDDNPRDEKPESIRKEIMLKCKKCIEIPNRKEAILKAVRDLRSKEILIIAGKGHEKYQIYEKDKKLFSDKKIANLALLEKIKNEKIKRISNRK